MSKYGYTDSDKFRPLSPWEYVGFSILFLVPIVGLLTLIVITFSDSNINRRSFARSYWCFLFLITIIIVIIAGPSLYSIISSGNGEMIIEKAETFLSEILKIR